MIKVIPAPLRSKTTADRPRYDASRMQFFLEDVENKAKLKPGLGLVSWTPSPESHEFVADAVKRLTRKRGAPGFPRSPDESFPAGGGGSSGDGADGDTEDASGSPKTARVESGLFREATTTAPAGDADNVFAPAGDASRPPAPPPDVYINEEDERRHYLYQFAYLERLYPNEHMMNPRLRESLPLEQLKNDYLSLSKRFDLDSRLEMFVTCFIFGFMMMEKFSGLEGLCEHHMENMPTYQRLMLKMSDKPLFRMMDKMAPEMVLVGVIVLQTVVFYCNKRWFAGDNQLIKRMSGALQSAALKSVAP